MEMNRHKKIQWRKEIISEVRSGHRPDLIHHLIPHLYFPYFILYQSFSPSDVSTYDGTYGTEQGTGELDLITLTASTPHNTELLVSKVEVRVKVTPVNDAPVLYVQYGIYSDGSTVSSSSSPSYSSSSSYFYSYSSDSMSATATAGSGSGSGSSSGSGSDSGTTSVTTTDHTRVLTEDMLSPMILSTLILYTKENIPLLSLTQSTIRSH